MQKAQAASLRGTGERHRGAASGFKHKDLVGVPYAVAFALRADGWWLRDDIVWSKTNPLPESIDDRPSRSHEFMFLLTKSGKPTFWTHRTDRGRRRTPEPDFRWLDLANANAEQTAEPTDWNAEMIPGPLGPRGRWRRLNLWRGHDYYYDSVAIREFDLGTDHRRNQAAARPSHVPHASMHAGLYTRKGRNGNGRNKRSVWEIPDELINLFFEWLEGQEAGTPDVWRIATRPFPGAHFAVFPADLVAPCVMAGSSPQACETCGAPWARVVDREFRGDLGARTLGHDERAVGRSRNAIPGSERAHRGPATLGWRATCSHRQGDGRCVVLDPFAGAATTGQVAAELGRDFIGIELNPEYAQMGRDRIAAWEVDPTGSLAGDPAPLDGQLAIGVEGEETAHG